MKKIKAILILLSLIFLLVGCNATRKNDLVLNQPKIISLEEAKAISLEKLGLSEDKVVFIKAQHTEKDNDKVYEIDFTYNSTQYEFTISQTNGEILTSKETVLVALGITDGKNDGLITKEQAMNIVLARVKGATKKNFVKINLEREKNRLVYDGDLVYKGKEYDFEIDAKTGNVLEWKVENYPDKD